MVIGITSYCLRERKLSHFISARCLSKFSGHDGSKLGKSRQPLYADPRRATAKDLIGLAVSLPKVTRDRPAEAYLEGTARWRPVL
jgi:hypothetical protein